MLLDTGAIEPAPPESSPSHARRCQGSSDRRQRSAWAPAGAAPRVARYRRGRDRPFGAPPRGPAGDIRLADPAEPRTLSAALADAGRVAVCIHARFAPAILAALPDRIERIVLTGSTRRFTRFVDAAAEEVIAAEAVLTASGRPGVIIHPTMICGPDGENNVQRVATYIRRFGVVPLPQGGRTLIQPIYVDDVVACLDAGLFRSEAPGSAIVAAGPAAVPYRDFVLAIARADRPARAHRRCAGGPAHRRGDRNAVPARRAAHHPGGGAAPPRGQGLRHRRHAPAPGGRAPGHRRDVGAKSRGRAVIPGPEFVAAGSVPNGVTALHGPSHPLHLHSRQERHQGMRAHGDDGGHIERDESRCAAPAPDRSGRRRRRGRRGRRRARPARGQGRAAPQSAPPAPA